MTASVEPVNFERYRASFHVPDGAYFLSHSIGCLPMTAEQSLQSRGLQPWRTRGAVWSQWIQAVESFSEAIAELLGAPAHSVCPQANVSSALAKILYALPERKGRKRLLLSEDDFPSLGFVMAQARRVGYELQYLPRGADLLDLSVWDDALAGDVQLALITHVQSDTGARLPAERIARLCREREIFSVLDVAQSVGVIPIELGELPADFAVGSCVKWLCGGPGAGFLYAADEICGQCEPLDVGWFSHEDPFEFDIREFRYAPGAKRFWGGTPSIWPYVVAESGVRLLLGIGIDEIRRHNQRLLDLMRSGIDRQTLVSPADPGRRGGTLVLDFGDNAAAVAHLGNEGIACDWRRRGVRLSPHVYNRMEEAERIVEVCRSF